MWDSEGKKFESQNCWEITRTHFVPRRKKLAFFRLAPLLSAVAQDSQVMGPRHIFVCDYLYLCAARKPRGGPGAFYCVSLISINTHRFCNGCFLHRILDKFNELQNKKELPPYLQPSSHPKNIQMARNFSSRPLRKGDGTYSQCANFNVTTF